MTSPYLLLPVLKLRYPAATEEIPWAAGSEARSRDGGCAS